MDLISDCGGSTKGVAKADYQNAADYTYLDSTSSTFFTWSFM